MAGEVTLSALSDATVSASLHQEIYRKLGDRASLLMHPAIRYIGSVNGTGSNVKKATLWGGDLDAMAAVAEGSSASNTALTNASVSVTVARQAIQRSVTDLGALTWSYANIESLIEKLSNDMAGSAKRRATSIICDIVDGFTLTAGSTGVDFSVTNWFTAQGLLQDGSNEGPFLAILAPEQVKNLQASLRAETGPLQFHLATPELMAIKGQGYVGSFMGVDIFVSSLVPTANAGADVAGCMMAYGAVSWADGFPTPLIGAGGIKLSEGPFYVGLERDESGGLTKVVGNLYFGAAMTQDAMGVSIITDAP